MNGGRGSDDCRANVRGAPALRLPPYRQSPPPFLGVVTMEDIIETIIGREIVDESDTIVDLQAYAREKWLKQMK